MPRPDRVIGHLTPWVEWCDELEKGLATAKAALHWKALECDRLRHDIDRHIAITSEQATEITKLQARLESEEAHYTRLVVQGRPIMD